MKINALVLSLFVSFSAFGQLSDAEWQLLQEVAQARETNLAKISSWQGQAVVERKRGDTEGNYKTHTYEQAYFASDNSSKSKRWIVKVHNADYIHDAAPFYAGTWDDRDNPETYASILSENHRYQFNPSTLHPDGSWTNQLVIQERTSLHPNSGRERFEPFYFLNDRRGNAVNHFVKIWKDEEKRKSYPLGSQTVTRQEDIVTWNRQYPGGQTSQYEFDLSKGGNLVRFVLDKSQEKVEVEWTLDADAQVWLPYTYERKLHTTSRGKELFRGEKVTFLKSNINDVLDEKDFQMERIGVQPGTQVADYVTGIVYKYGAPETAKEFYYSKKDNRWTTD